MSNIKYQMMGPFKALRHQASIPEREFAKQAGVSRSTLRSIERGEGSVSLEHYIQTSNKLDRNTLLLSVPQESSSYSECSTLGASLLVLQNGFSSWKIHFFNLVDEFRRGFDPLLLILPPPPSLDEKLKALLASIVKELCREAQIDSPQWAQKRMFLDNPWFVSEMDTLKAFAIHESPLAFRINNIYVHENFLKRA